MSTYGTLWEQVRHERDMLKGLGITNTNSLTSAQAEYAKLKETFAAKCREIESRLANWAEIEKDMDKPDDRRTRDGSTPHCHVDGSARRRR